MARRRRGSGTGRRYDVVRGEAYLPSSDLSLPPYSGYSRTASLGELYGQLLELASSPKAPVYPTGRGFRPVQYSRGFSFAPLRGAAQRGWLPTPFPFRERVRDRAALPWLQVRLPQRDKVCIQRASRREVLFAMRRAGYGGSARKRHWNRTSNSQWRC